MEHPNFTKNIYLLFNRIVDVEPYSFYYKDETTGEETPWDGGLMFECYIFSKLPGKTDDLRKLQIADPIYSKIKKLDEEQIVKYLAELNSKELFRIKTEQKFWKNSKKDSIEDDGIIKQTEYLADLIFQYKNWFHSNEVSLPNNTLDTQMKSEKRIRWRLEEKYLRSFLQSCMNSRYIEKVADIDEYVANFTSEENYSFVKTEPKEIKWLTFNTDLIYLIWQLNFRGIIQNSGDPWKTISQIFVNKFNKKYNNKTLAVQFSRDVIESTKKRTNLDTIISALTSKP